VRAERFPRGRLLLRATRRTNELVTGRVGTTAVVLVIGAFVGVATTARQSSAPGGTPPTAASSVEAALAGGLFSYLGVSLVVLVTVLMRYRLTGYRDDAWEAGHGSEGLRSLHLILRRRHGAMLNVELECFLRQPSGEVREFEDREANSYGAGGVLLWVGSLMDSPPGEYEARWYIRNRGRFVELTRDRFTLAASAAPPADADTAP